MRRYLIGIFFLVATNAQAECAPRQQVFLSCQIEGQTTALEVCFDSSFATYSYGPIGGPAELKLSERLARLGYTPWPGMGRSIWEDVTFTNGDYSYTVFGGFDRMFGDETEEDHPTPLFGGVSVLKGDAEIASLTCDRASVVFGWNGNDIAAAKMNAARELEYHLRSWRKAPR